MDLGDIFDLSARVAKALVAGMLDDNSPFNTAMIEGFVRYNFQQLGSELKFTH